MQSSSPNSAANREEQVADGFRKLLDRHGFAFQHAVLKRARDLAVAGQSHWQAEASEFPSEVRSTTTHIDFVLRRPEKEYFLVCECKRANPALADWCFAQAPFTRRDHDPSAVVSDDVTRISDSPYVSASPSIWAHGPDTYQIGLEVQSGVKGEAHGSGRNAINEAVGQVLRGVNGLVNIFGQHSQILRPNGHALLIATVFTTATLWVSDVKLDTADLATGKLPETTRVHKVPWLVFDHHQSPALKHSILAGGRSDDLVNILGTHYARSVFIVSWDGIDNFLEWSSSQ